MSRRLKCTCAIVLMGLLVSHPRHDVSALRVEPYRDLLAVELVVQGLNIPAGMAVDPVSGLLHVAEQGGKRIAVVRDRAALPLVQNDFQISSALPGWATYPGRPLDDWLQPDLRSPSGLAFDEWGRLYVAEAGERGRLLRFEPFDDDLRFAQVITSPWIEGDLGYTSVQVDRVGRIYVTMQKADRDGVLAFGRVLQRDIDGEWYLIDYGPFAEFSNVVLSPDHQTLLVAEHRTADVTWYDIDRQMLFGAMERVNGVRHVAALPDGTTLASLQRADETWSVVEVDPAHGRIWEWVGGLTEIGGLAAHPEDGSVFVSLKQEGRIMRMYRIESETDTPRGNRLTALLQTFEMENALPPKEWPEFFREFIERLGMVEAVDHVMSSLTPIQRSMSRVPMSIDEFTTAIPVVAAKLKVTLLSEPELEPDPIEELSFVIFYPNRTIHTRQSIAPSVSLFRAEHKSGRVIRTRFMPNQFGQQLTEDLDWDNLPDVLVSFPSGYYAQRTGLSEEGLLRAYFLGMGFGADYWIDVHRVDRNRSIMMVEKANGQKVEYFLEPYPERAEAGGETVLVAGLSDVEKGWQHLGSTPVMWNVVIGEPPPLNARNIGRWQTEAWRHAQVEASVAAPHTQRLTRDDVTFRRAIVLRAATRWHDVHF